MDSNNINNNFINPNKTFYSCSEWVNSRTFSAKYVRIIIAKQMGDSEKQCNTLLNW